MKKSELRKIIREVISEQTYMDAADIGDYAISDFVDPNTQNSSYGGTPILNITCPEGYKFYQKAVGLHGVATFSFDSQESLDAGNPPTDLQLTKCVPKVPPSVVTVDAEFCCDLDATNFGANAGGSLVANANEYLMQQGPEGQMCNNNLCSYTQGTGPDYQPPSPIVTQPKSQRRR